jgi:hypothetical protein
MTVGDSKWEVPDLQSNPGAWKFVRIYALIFDSNIEGGQINLILDIDLPIESWVNTESNQFNFLVSQAEMTFESVHEFKASMDSGHFDPCELVVDEVQIVKDNMESAGDVFTWQLSGPWFALDISARRVAITSYRAPESSDRPWLPFSQRRRLTRNVG